MLLCRALRAADFTGLIGSQASEISIATSSLTRPRPRSGRRWAEVLVLDQDPTCLKRRVFSFLADREADALRVAWEDTRLRNIAGTEPSTTVFGRLRRS